MLSFEFKLGAAWKYEYEKMPIKRQKLRNTMIHEDWLHPGISSTKTYRYIIIKMSRNKGLKYFTLCVMIQHNIWVTLSEMSDKKYWPFSWYSNLFRCTCKNHSDRLELVFTFVFPQKSLYSFNSFWFLNMSYGWERERQTVISTVDDMKTLESRSCSKWGENDILSWNSVSTSFLRFLSLESASWLPHTSSALYKDTKTC